MDLRVEGIEVILDVVYNHTAAVSVSTKPIVAYCTLQCSCDREGWMALDAVKT